MTSAQAILDQPAYEAVPRRRKRIITDLRWARRSSRQKGHRKISKCTRAQREGIRFEARLMKALRKLPFDEFYVGPWYTFEDANGVGFCQPDAVAITADGRPLVIEVKLTQTQRAVREIETLYAPLVEAIYGEAPRLCVAFRNWAYHGSQFGVRLDACSDLILPDSEQMTLVDARVT